jgi:hypothetical protein
MGDVFLVDRYVITKNIAKHGKSSIIVIPSVLNSELQPKTTVKVTIEVIKRPEERSCTERSGMIAPASVPSEFPDGLHDELILHDKLPDGPRSARHEVVRR